MNGTEISDRYQRAYRRTNEQFAEAGRKFIAKIIDEEFTVSFITYIEFLGYKDATKETEDFIALANVLEINKEIIQRCIKVRKSNVVKLPDAIIAATALVNDLTLTTRNMSDFKNIPGLKIVNPWELQCSVVIEKVGSQLKERKPISWRVPSPYIR